MFNKKETVNYIEVAEKISEASNVEIVESFIFPKIKDKYQDISYEYIRESFNTLKIFVVLMCFLLLRVGSIFYITDTVLIY